MSARIKSQGAATPRTQTIKHMNYPLTRSALLGTYTHQHRANRSGVTLPGSTSETADLPIVANRLTLAYTASSAINVPDVSTIM